MEKKVWAKKIGTFLLIAISIVVFPFVLEFVLYKTPVISRFTNETWFSFMASYVGAIATFVVLRITLKENQKAVEDEKRRLRRNYEIEKEISEAKDIQKVLLLDKYDFLNMNTLVIDFMKFRKDMYDIQFKIREFQFDEKGQTARDKYFMNLWFLERYYTFYFAEEKRPKENDREGWIKYVNSIEEKTTEWSHNAMRKRKEIMDLYKEYVDEMKRKEFE